MVRFFVRSLPVVGSIAAVFAVGVPLMMSNSSPASSATALQGAPQGAPAPVLAPAGENWTMPKIVAQPTWGARIQRSMKLMASSTRSRRNRVKVLFYGQSITQQDWTKTVADDLRRRFPFTDFVFDNRAIGGFSSQLLVKTAEQDLYSFYPDLMIFHVYGSHSDYEKIIENVRRRTTADIVMQTDHVTKAGDLTEETDPAKLAPNQWDAWMNHSFLPQTARKFDVELADVRAGWKRHLQSEKLEPKLFLSDDVHLNNRGNALMATLVSPYLRYDASLPVQHANSVRDYPIGRILKWNKGRLKMTFSGNRVDVIADNNGKAVGAKAAGARAVGARVRVLIDGKSPSQTTGAMAFTRSSIGFSTWTPAITRFGSQALLVPETWTARITEISADGKKFKYSVRGSVTGEDGSGDSDNTFVSNSKRVVIDPADWWLGFSKSPMPVGFEVTWQVVPQGVDIYQAPEIADKAIEYSTTLAQGFANTSHTLELVALDKNPPPIAAIRVYEPPLKP
ncbi:MAG TPA: SGNH/GDSL hydrolase family protein [Abditibacteriaceae bacterium]|nr:SGNH/GDSL hydrolase family protein [Abditibacteriaceae bacterium]